MENGLFRKKKRRKDREIPLQPVAAIRGLWYTYPWHAGHAAKIANKKVIP